MKRITSLILIICISLTMMPLNVWSMEQSNTNRTMAEALPDTTNPFEDVSETDWFYDSVLYVLEKGLFNGMGDGTFFPYGTMTRSMFVTVLGRMARVNPNDYIGSSRFTDVHTDAYYAPYIAWAVEQGITMGVGDNRFSPDGIVSREQMAVFMIRFFEAQGVEYAHKSDHLSEPQDLSEVSPWAQDSVLKLWKAGLLVGDQNGLFNPQAHADRAAAAAFCARSNQITAAWREKTENSLPTPSPSLTPTPTSTLTPTPTPTPSPTPTPTQSPTQTSTPVPTPTLVPTSTPAPSPVPSTTPTPSPSPDDGGNVAYYTVSFVSNGGIVPEPIMVRDGSTPSSLPTPKKENAVFLGWFKDAGLQDNPFTEGNTVHSNLTLYAKYLEIESIVEEEQDDSFSLPDQEPALAFHLISSDKTITADLVESDLVLEAVNGSEPLELIVSGGDGNFTVQAVNGFTEGASYRLTLNEAHLSFSEKDPHVRLCSFTIKKDEVFDLQFSDDIIYIPDEHVTNIAKDNVQVQTLSVPLVTMTGEENDSSASTTGTFTYVGSLELEIGDDLCIYSGEKPGPGDDSAYLGDDIAYVTIIGINGSVITFSDSEAEDVLFIPDMLPIYVGEGHTLTDYVNDGSSGSFTASLFNLDFGSYGDLGLSADTTIDVGDYLLFSLEDLTSAQDVPEEEDQEEDEDESEEAGISYGEVTSVETEGTLVKIQFKAATLSEMQNTGNYYSQNDVDGEHMLDGVDIENLEEQIAEQVLQSGFADKAATYLTTFAMATDGFMEVARANGGMDSLRIMMADGSAVSANEFRLMALDAKKVQLKEKKVSAKVNQKPKNFDKGVHCEIKVTLNIQIQAGDDSVIDVKLAATFVEEVKISVNASGKADWKKKKIKIGFVKVKIPYIDDYSMSADIDVYNYTAVDFEAVVSSKGDVSSIDVSQQIQKLLGNDDKEEITNGVRELYQLYSDMMASESDWIDIFDQTILILPVSLLGGVIQIRVTANFVAAANINVAIGCNYESKSGTRYCFWAKLEAKKAGSSTLELLDETYSFRFYVMGTLGLRTGIRLEVAVGLFSLNLNSVGIEAEAGIFTRLYGFFFYEKKLENKKVTSNKSGAMYFELGAYLEVALTAQAMNGKYKSSLDIVDKEWTLLTAGQRYNVFDFAYEDPPAITFSDKSKTSVLPDNTFQMTYLDLREGESAAKTYKIGDYLLKFSDNRFSFKDGRITANVPSQIHYLECDMTVTWKHSPLAFSSVPIARTYKLVWDTLDKGGYTILFESNGGSVVKNITKKYGEAVSVPVAPKKTGYTFAGWYTDRDLKKAYTFTTMGWNDITLYAKWTANKNTKYKVEHYQQDVTNSSKYTLVETQTLTGTTGASITPSVKSYTGFKAPSTRAITIAADGSTVLEYKYTRNTYKLTFVPENGEGSIVNNLKLGAAIKAPVLKKTGHTFAGWDMKVAATMPAGNLTYTAGWKKNTYTVSFDSNGGSKPSGITVTYGNPYGTLPVPSKAGYTFLGWYTNEQDNVGFGTLVTAETTAKLTSAQILHAKWAGNPNTPYVVEHYLQNINDNGYPSTPFEIQNQSGTAGTEVTPPVKSNNGFKAPYLKTVTIAGNGSTVVKYYYLRNSYQLTLKHGNGADDSATTVKYGDTLVLPDDLALTGYVFGGWTPAPTGTMPAQDTIYTAIWTPSDKTAYVVRHYTENPDGSFKLVDTEELQGTTNAIVTPGLKVYPGFTSPEIQTVTIAADGSTVVDYYYTRDSYQLTFKYGNGMEDTSEFVKYGANLSQPANPTRAGYTFGGWAPAPAETMPAQNTTYTAIWTPGNKTAYVVRHLKQDLDGSGYTLANTQELEGTTNAAVTPELKAFEGFTAPNAQTVTIAANGTTVVEYRYTRNSYQVTFNPENGDAAIVVTFKYGAAITPPQVYQDGYTFVGWTPELAEAMPAEELTYTAVWTINNNTPYTVRHLKQDLDGSGYTLADTEELEGTTNETVTPELKAYEGFTAPDAQTIAIAADGSTVVEYRYTRNSYQVTFNPDNGDAAIVATFKYGAAITPPQVYQDGYTFFGWTPAPAEVMPAEELTYSAVWTINDNTPYTVKHLKQDLDGSGYTVADTEELEGTTNATVTPELKAFEGFTAPDAQTVAIKADGTTVVEYRYTRNSYQVTFNPENGQEAILTTIKYGAAITAPEVTQDGYTFVGWTPELVDVMPAAELTYTAVWTINNNTPYTVRHLKQNLDGSGYTLYDTEELEDTTNATVTPELKAYEGFTAPDLQTVTIAADGTTVVEYRYTRNSYQVIFNPDNGEAAIVATFKFGAAITPPEVTKGGDTFSGWAPELAATMPAQDITYTAIWIAEPTGWVKRDTGTTSGINDVIYANGAFVAVGNDGTLLTSPDGVVWTLQDSGTTNHYRSVVFGEEDGLFVVTGDSGTILTSEDGQSWIRRETSIIANFKVVLYGNGTYMAATANQFCKSDDGITWTTYEGGFTDSVSGARFLNGQFVFTTSNAHVYFVDADFTGLSSYVQIHYPTTGNGLQIRNPVYGNGVYVFSARNNYVGVIQSLSSSHEALEDLDGYTNQQTFAAKFINGLFYLGARYGKIFTSENGYDFTQTNTPSGFPLEYQIWDILYTRGQFFGSGEGGRILESVNGVDWTLAEPVVDKYLPNLAASPERVIAAGAGGTIISKKLSGK